MLQQQRNPGDNPASLGSATVRQDDLQQHILDELGWDDDSDDDTDGVGDFLGAMLDDSVDLDAVGATLDHMLIFLDSQVRANPQAAALRMEILSVRGSLP